MNIVQDDPHQIIQDDDSKIWIKRCRIRFSGVDLLKMIEDMINNKIRILNQNTYAIFLCWRFC